MIDLCKLGRRAPASWFLTSPLFQGCHFGVDTQNIILLKLWKSLKDAGLLDSGVSISASDETNIDTACQSMYNYSPSALACISQINTHCVSNPPSHCGSWQFSSTAVRLFLGPFTFNADRWVEAYLQSQEAPPYNLLCLLTECLLLQRGASEKYCVLVRLVMHLQWSGIGRIAKACKRLSSPQTGMHLL